MYSSMHKVAGSINWNRVSFQGNLTDEFIIENNHRLNWDILVRYQKLSHSILLRYHDRIKEYDLIKYQDIKNVDELKVEAMMKGYI